MDALAGYGSDETSSSSDAEQAHSPLQAEISDTTSKRQRIAVEEHETELLFQPPCLSDKDSMISWSKDVTAAYRTVLSDDQISSVPPVPVDFITNLSQQHEFMNPSFFGTIVDHFGIKDELGSHIKGEELEGYEFRLWEIEEQERHKQTEREQLAGVTCNSFQNTYL